MPRLDFERGIKDCFLKKNKSLIKTLPILIRKDYLIDSRMISFSSAMSRYFGVLKYSDIYLSLFWVM